MRMVDYPQSTKGTGARNMVMLSGMNNFLVHKSAGIPKFALLDCACCPE